MAAVAGARWEEAGVGQMRARCDGGLPVSHSWNVDTKAGAPAATVDIYGKLNIKSTLVKHQEHTRDRAEQALPPEW